VIKSSGSTRRNNSTKRILQAAILAAPAVAAAVLTVQTAKGADLFWDMDPAAGGAVTGTGTAANGTWNPTNTNWNADSAGGTSPGVVVWADGSRAVFAAGADNTTATTVTIAGFVAGSPQVAGMVFEEATFTIQGGGLTLTDANIITNNSANTARTATISSIIDGTVGLNHNGLGTLNLRGVNIFTGNVTSGAGTLDGNSDAAFGNAANNIILNGSSTVQFSGSFNTSRNINVNSTTANLSVTGAAVNVTWNGAIQGTSNTLNKTGTGKLVVAGTYNPTITNINGGNFEVASAGTLSGSTQMTINSGGTFTPVSGSAQTINLSTLTMNPGSFVNFDLGAPSTSDVINVTTAGGLALNGTNGTLGLNLTDLGPGTTIAPGTYTLFDYNTSFVGNVNNLFVNSAPAGFDFEIVNNGTNTSIDINVSLAAGSASSTWNVDADGSYSTAANWTTGVPAGVGAVANFDNVITAPRTVNLTSARTIGTLNFNNANAYTLTGAPLTLDVASGNAAVNVTQGSHSIVPTVTVNDPTNFTISAVGTEVRNRSAASSSMMLGRTKLLPRSSSRRTASSTFGCRWPRLTARKPEPYSMYSLPSTSQTCAPSPRSITGAICSGNWSSPLA